SLSGYSIGKTIGLFYLAAVSVAIARATEPGDEEAVLRALGTGALWSAAVGLVGFALSFGGISTSLMEYDRVCSTMPGAPTLFCSLLAVGLVVTVNDRRLSPVARCVRVAVVAVALLTTGSRSGTIAAVVAVVACAVIGGRDPWVAVARVTF